MPSLSTFILSFPPSSWLKLWTASEQQNHSSYSKTLPAFKTLCIPQQMFEVWITLSEPFSGTRKTFQMPRLWRIVRLALVRPVGNVENALDCKIIFITLYLIAWLTSRYTAPLRFIFLPSTPWFSDVLSYTLSFIHYLPLVASMMHGKVVEII